MTDTLPVVRPGIYLEDNPPTGRYRQYRPRDLSKGLRPVIVVHTAEWRTDFEGPDPSAESCAAWIVRRTDAGCYHILGDADSVIQLAPFHAAAYHDGTGSNDWSIGISLAMQAGTWTQLTEARRRQFVRTAAVMAAWAGRWYNSRGLGFPDPVRLTKAQSNARTASGFIAHGDRDPGRRSDPGADFPWSDFLTLYAGLTEQESPNMATISDDLLAAYRALTVKVQQRAKALGYDLGTSGPNRDGVDAWPGQKTMAAANAILAAADDDGKAAKAAEDLAAARQAFADLQAVLDPTA